MSKFYDMAKALGLTPDSPSYNELLERAKAADASGPDWTSQVEGISPDPEVLEELGEECLQLTLARETKTLSAVQLIQQHLGQPLQATYEEYDIAFARYGFSDVTLLRELPIAYLVAGYTRLGARASNPMGSYDIQPQFKFFDATRQNRFPIYGMRTETEGLLFQLDELRVLQWLVDSNVVKKPTVSTRAGARRWLFANVEPVGDPFKEPHGLLSKAVLGLVHSIAHRTMKALAARSGLNVDSLAEYLFPSNGAFLIYANTRSDFTLGGIEHVFRYDLLEALDELGAESRCIFDPPCRRSPAFGGACAACLHVSEIACARFNTVLDRNLLFGSLPNEEDAPQHPGNGTSHQAEEPHQWQAFWNH